MPVVLNRADANGTGKNTKAQPSKPQSKQQSKQQSGEKRGLSRRTLVVVGCVLLVGLLGVLGYSFGMFGGSNAVQGPTAGAPDSTSSETAAPGTNLVSHPTSGSRSKRNELDRD